MKILIKKLLFKLVEIGDFSHCDDSEASEMRIEDDRLGIGVADYAYSRISSEFVKFVLEFGSEISTFEVVNRPTEAKLIIVGYHTATASAEVRVVVGAIKQVGAARRFGYSSKKATHK